MSYESGDSVSEIVQGARNEIILANGSSALKFESLCKLRGFLYAKETKESKQFIDVYYSEFVLFLLSNLDPSWLKEYVDGKLFEDLLIDFIMQGPSEQAFISACQSLKNLKTWSYHFQKVVILICQLLENNCICNTLSKKCQEHYDILFIGKETFRRFVQFVSSLPDMVLGQSNGAVPTDMFYPEKYSLHISQQIIATLSFCHDKLVDNCDISVKPVSIVLSKMCISGYGQNIWKHIIDPIAEKFSQNVLWKRLLQKVISNVDDWCLDCTIDPLIICLKNSKMMTDVLGNLPLNNCRLESILTVKFILSRYFSDVSIPRKILEYFASHKDRKHLFDKIMISVLRVWRQKALVKFQPFEQTYYLCQIILISLCLSKKMEFISENVKKELNKTALESLPIYLNSLMPEVRQMGMIIAQNLVRVGGCNIKLELPIEDNQFNKYLTSLLQDDINLRSLSKEEMCDLSNNVKIQNVCNDSLDSDDDDGLKPFSSVSNANQPTYLVQCIEGLSNYDDHKYMEECLKICRYIIESSSDLGELDIELCKRLICLEDRFSLSNFHELKNDALVSLITKNPQAIAPFLIGQFYERNYSVQQRFEILDVLIVAVKKLSFPEPCNEVVADDDKCPSIMAKDWQQVVQRRLDLKTRRFANSNSKAKPRKFKNEFSACAGWFFYPLLRNFDTKEYLSVYGEDHLLLEKLLNTLATVMYCSINIPASGNMAKALLQFSSGFRAHAEAGVRRAALHTTYMCIVAFEASHTLSDVSQELCELYSWINVAILKDPDMQFTELLNQTLTMLNSLRTKLLL